MLRLICLLVFITSLISAQNKTDTVVIVSGGGAYVRDVILKDVAGTFNLWKKYKTLKETEAFVASPEGRKLKDSIPIIKKEILSHTYEIKFNSYFSKYSADKKGHEILLTLGNSFGYAEFEAYKRDYTKVLHEIYFPDLPVEIIQMRKKNPYYYKFTDYGHCILIKCDKSIVSQLEDKKIDIRIIFTFSGNVKKVADNTYPVAKDVMIQFILDDKVIYKKKYGK